VKEVGPPNRLLNSLLPCSPDDLNQIARLCVGELPPPSTTRTAPVTKEASLDGKTDSGQQSRQVRHTPQHDPPFDRPEFGIGRRVILLRQQLHLIGTLRRPHPARRYRFGTDRIGAMRVSKRARIRDHSRLARRATRAVWIRIDGCEDAMLTIAPPSCSTSGKAARHTHIVPVRLTSSVLAQTSSDTFSGWSGIMRPAALTTTSSRSPQLSMARTISALSVTSPGTASPLVSAAAASSSASPRPNNTTRAPFCANIRAVARPMRSPLV